MTMAIMEIEKAMKRIRNTKIKMLRIRRHTKTKIQTMMKNKETRMKKIGHIDK